MTLLNEIRKTLEELKSSMQNASANQLCMIALIKTNLSLLEARHREELLRAEYQPKEKAV